MQILGALFGKNRVHSMILGDHMGAHACIMRACEQLKLRRSLFPKSAPQICIHPAGRERSFGGNPP